MRRSNGKAHEKQQLCLQQQLVETDPFLSILPNATLVHFVHFDREILNETLGVCALNANFTSAHVGENEGECLLCGKNAAVLQNCS